MGSSIWIAPLETPAKPSTVSLRTVVKLPYGSGVTTVTCGGRHGVRRGVGGVGGGGGGKGSRGVREGGKGESCGSKGRGWQGALRSDGARVVL